ncbi:MAG: STAS domain-containing protein [Planctomycetes bacterium]|nr:STAS domain-containing protein [Planctomycetota bacterium]
MTTRLQLTGGTEGHDHVVMVRGEVDMESAPRLLDEIQHGLKHASRAVVDLAGVSYIDSSGIAVLVQGLKSAMKRGKEFVLRAPSAQVAAVLKLAQLQQLFKIEPAPDQPR